MYLNDLVIVKSTLGGIKMSKLFKGSALSERDFICDKLDVAILPVSVTSINMLNLKFDIGMLKH